MMLPALGLLLVLQEAPLPALIGRVVDEAGLLSGAEEQGLSQRLEALERETSVQIAIATVLTIDDEPIEDYSLRLAEEWKIGQAGLDNGAIILVVRDDRRVRIEVGYGLEPVIPDGLAGRILRERITPAFARGEYYEGLLSGIEGLELAARKEYPEAPDRSPAPPGFDFGAMLFAYLIIGTLGNAFGIVVAILAGALLFPFLGGSIAQSLGIWAYAVGAMLGLAAVLFLRGFGRRGSWTSPGRHRGGAWGGGFGGGGFGGGGGGGFRGGGGSFGGGGASGRW